MSGAEYQETQRPRGPSARSAGTGERMERIELERELERCLAEAAEGCIGAPGGAGLGETLRGKGTADHPLFPGAQAAVKRSAGTTGTAGGIFRLNGPLRSPRGKSSSTVPCNFSHRSWSGRAIRALSRTPMPGSGPGGWREGIPAYGRSAISPISRGWGPSGFPGGSSRGAAWRDVLGASSPRPPSCRTSGSMRNCINTVPAAASACAIALPARSRSSTGKTI